MAEKRKVKNINISSDTLNPIEISSRERRIINDNTAFMITEAYKAARTNIMFSLNGVKGCKKIVFSSATSGEGKTTTCINIAKTFAQTGAKVIILDMDLRAPRIHKYIKINNDRGESNVLAGFDDLKDCIAHTDQPNFDCLTAGAIPPNPVELISSDSMVELLSELEKEYDYIFMDTPPLNIVTEAIILSKIATGIILVTRQKYTMYKFIERALEALEFADAKILGFILNDAENDKYVYGGYGRKSRKNRYVRYGYYTATKSKSSKEYKSADK